MKKIILILVVIVIYQKWGVINNYVNPAPHVSEAYSGEVILYATDWCGYCKKTRELFEENNIPYYEYDIEKSTEGSRQHKALGGNGVPVIVIDGTVIKGYNRSKILNLTGRR